MRIKILGILILFSLISHTAAENSKAQVSLVIRFDLPSLFIRINCEITVFRIREKYFYIPKYLSVFSFSLKHYIVILPFSKKSE
jgi:hypothetical protein